MATKKNTHIPSQIIDKLRNHADIIDIVRHRVPDLKKRGKDYKACCPFHRERTPSFTVSQDKQFYHCFGCGANGDVIEFLMEHDMLSFKEAIEELAAETGFPMQDISKELIPEPVEQDLYSLTGKVSEYFADNLDNHKQRATLKTFLDNLPIDRETVETYDLGFAPNSVNSLQGLFAPDKKTVGQLRKSGLLLEKANGALRDRFSNRLMFGIKDRRGRILGFGSAGISESSVTGYLTSPGTEIFHPEKELYGFYQARKANRNLSEILVVQDYLDVVRLAAAGLTNVVAPPGCDITKDHLAKLVRSAPVITFVFEDTPACHEAAWRHLNNALPILGGDYEFRFAFLPPGETIASIAPPGGLERFKGSVAGAEPLSSYLLHGLDAQIEEGEDWTRRLRALAEPMLKAIPNGAYKQMLQQEVTGQFKPLVLFSDHERTQVRKEETVSVIIKSDPISKALALLVNFPELSIELPDEGILSKLTSDEGFLLRKVSAYIDELNDRDLPATTAMIIERFRSDPSGNLLGLMACQADDIDNLAAITPEMIAVCEKVAASVSDDDELDLESLFSKPMSELTPSEREQLKKTSLVPRSRKFRAA